MANANMINLGLGQQRRRPRAYSIIENPVVVEPEPWVTDYARIAASRSQDGLERSNPSFFDPTIREKENLLPTPDRPSTIRMDRLPFSQPDTFAVFSTIRETQEKRNAAWSLINLARGRRQMPQGRSEDLGAELKWRLEVCEEYINKHWQFGDQDEVYEFVPRLADTSSQKQRRLRHYRRRMFAQVMSADVPDEDERNLWLDASDEEVEQRLRDFVDITCDGNEDRANAMLRSREGFLNQVEVSQIEPPRPMVRMTVLPPTTPTPEGFFTNLRPDVSYSAPRPMGQRRMKQASMLMFR
ncbi:hypothetical protein QBC34DRAFT_411903 [Podospora aff. communis PSN243]|uniref:Uncharacterized protein n=1 Tax=Podospora aff. communis PSN243 TaxID=3040156 RepID=A0AAV9GH43_9PEZI|nr:hypothetical protein QBC34DRAFT_411903 [Podospora aff. communis PSN243]